MVCSHHCQCSVDCTCTQLFLAKVVAECKYTGAPGVSLTLSAHSPALNLISKAPTLRVNTQQSNKDEQSMTMSELPMVQPAANGQDYRICTTKFKSSC